LHRLNEDLFEEEARMKAKHGLLAVMLFGTLSATDVAVARPRHPVSAESSGHGSKSSGTEQNSGDALNGGVKNSTGAATSTAGTNPNTNVGDKGNPNFGGPTEDGPIKKGQGLPGKTGPQNSGKGSVGDAGKNQIGEGRDHRGATYPSAKNGVAEHGVEPVRIDNVIVDHSGHKPKKPVDDTTKKVTTIVSKPPANGNQRIPGLVAIGGGEKNAVGLALHNDKDPKQGKDAKIDAKPPDPGPPGPAGIKSNPIAVTTNIAGHPGSNPNGVEGPPKIGAGLNGTLINRPGSGPSTIGGPVKNLASINGTSFRPKRGR
jgi:hypothetical protein